MKYILILLLFISADASAQQWNITGSKTRFATGLGVPLKTTATVYGADSMQIFTKADSSLWFAFHGAARALAFVGSTGSGTTLYTGDSTINGDRLVSLSTHTLRFGESGTTFFIDPVNKMMQLYHNSGDDQIYIDGTNHVIRHYTNDNQVFTQNSDGFVFQNGKVGISNPTPTYDLDISGQARISDGTQAAGYVFTSDATGLGSWQPTSGVTIDSIFSFSSDSVVVNRKLRIPRQDTSTARKQTGNIIFDTLQNQYYGYNGTQWSQFDAIKGMVSNGEGLKLSGNGNFTSPYLFAVDTGRTSIAITTGGALNKVADSLGAIIATKGTGTVTSVSGTTNRITSTGGTTPVIDISAAYVGQSSITTLGTVTTGTWNATAIPILYGGTGQTTANAAFNALAPTQTSNSGKYLTTDGTNTSWATVSSGGVTTLAAIGSTPNANGATISGSTLNLQPASLTYGGALTSTNFDSFYNWRPTVNKVVTAGSIFTDNFARSSLGGNYTATGSSPTFPSSLYLQYTGGTNVWTQYILRTDKSISTSQHIDSVKFVPSVLGNGIGIGVKSWVANVTRDMVVKFVSNGVATLYSQENNANNLISTATLAAGTTDSLLGIVMRFDTSITIIYKNLTTGVSVNATYGYTTASTAGALMPPTGNPALYNFGGTNNVAYWSVTNMQNTRNDVITGNSLMFYTTSSLYKTFPYKTYNNRTDYSTIGGAGDRIAQMLLDLPEFSTYSPHAVFNLIGTNDVLNATAIATFTTNYDSMVHYEVNAGVIKGYCLAIPPTTSPVKQYNDSISRIAATRGFTYIDTYNPFKVVGAGTTLAAWCDAGDGIHLNDSGYTVLAQILQPYRNRYTTNSGIPNPYSLQPPLTLDNANIQATRTDGLVLTNSVNATAGVTAQRTGSIRFHGTAWKSNATAASQYHDYAIEEIPVTGAGGITSTLSIGLNNNGAGYTNILTLSNGGNLVVAGNVTATGTIGTFSTQVNTASIVNASGVTLNGGSASLSVVTGKVTISEAGTLTPSASLLTLNRSGIVANNGAATTTNGSANVTGTAAALFQEHLRIGDNITINGETKVVATITDQTHLTTTATWTGNNTSQVYTYSTGNVATFRSSGLVGIGITAPAAFLEIQAGTSSNAPFGLTSGTNLTTPSAGKIEYDGTNLFFTPSTVRQTVYVGLAGSATLDFASTAAATSSDLTITVTGAASGDPVELGVPNTSVNANSCYTAWVSAADTVTVRFNNYQTVGAIDPASATFKVFVKKN